MELKYFAFLIILLIAPVANADVIINEIMYAPNSYWGGQYNEWIELYNNGAEDVNITSWTIDGKTIPAAAIPAGGFTILARNSTKFYEIYGLPSIYVPFTYGLSNDGEILNLSSNGAAIDIFDYVPYANLAKNNNRSLERNASGWFESIAIGGTTGAENSVFSSGAPPVNSSLNETPNTTNTSQPINTAEETNIQNTQQNQELSKPATIEIIRAPDALKFGDYSSIRARFYSGSREFSKARFVAYIFKPSWISRDLTSDETTLRNSPHNSNAAAEVSGINSNETYYLVLPLFLKCNTGGFVNAAYTARVRAYAYENSEWKTLAESDRDIFVSGESDICKKEASKEKASANKTAENACAEKVKVIREETLLINVTYPETVFSGENFTTTVFLENNENLSRDLEVYSYIYEHSAVVSNGFDSEKWGNARTANARKITLGGGNSATIELVTRARENITAEKYTYKVRIDDLNDDKNSEERVYLIDVKAREASGINETTANSTDKENKITGAALLKNTGATELSFWDRIIYKIKSWLE